MKAIHIDAEHIGSDAELVFVEAWLRMLNGVADVAAVRSLDLVSVLYDERETDPSAILRTLRSFGLTPRLLTPRRWRTSGPAAASRTANAPTAAPATSAAR